MPQINFGNQKIGYERLPTKSKDCITVRVGPDKSVSVLAPIDVCDEELTKIVQSKSIWIVDKFQRIDEIRPLESNRELISGEGLLYKGKLLRLKIQKSDDPCDCIFSDTTTLFCKVNKEKDQKYIHSLLEGWYIKNAKEYIENRAVKLAKKFTKKPAKVIVRNQLLRWGSCTKEGDLILNWRIIMAPPSIIDYVIVHEMAHLHEKNHTEQFWTTVKNAMPDYEVKKEWLRVNGPLLGII